MFTGEWMNDFASISVVPTFTKNFDPWCTSIWLHFTTVGASGGNITHHPNYVPPDGASAIIYDPPVMDCSTAAYKVGAK